MSAAGGGGGPDAELTRALDAAASGDERAFVVVYRLVAPGLLRYLRVLVGDDAEDVASESWLQIVRDLASFAGDGEKFRGWAATVARHRALDHLRARRRRPVADLPLAALDSLASGDDTAAGAVEAISTDAAVALIASLPRDQAEAVMLRVVLGLDAAAAGRVLGKRPGAVRTAAHRGLRRLAEQLEAERLKAEQLAVEQLAVEQLAVERRAREAGEPGRRGTGGRRSLDGTALRRCDAAGGFGAERG